MNTFQFWRPIILAAVVCLVTVLACRYLLQRPQPGGVAESAFLSLDYPRKALSPRDVVELQIGGLTNTDDPVLGALQCYCFAAPSNRLVTGPFERFAKMVRSTPWDCLSSCQSYSIGSAQVEGNDARVLVTVVGEDREFHLFAFLLTRQQAEPFEGCWMTAGAFALENVDSDPSAMPNSAESEIPRKFPHPGWFATAYHN